MLYAKNVFVILIYFAKQILRKLFLEQQKLRLMEIFMIFKG